MIGLLSGTTTVIDLYHNGYRFQMGRDDMKVMELMLISVTVRPNYKHRKNISVKCNQTQS